ncbi:MAG: acylneuraminate cytidylyltransferase family protein [Anaerolineales bacterium]|nr:acylneuraminate cytidylyltransferase family protein [Anaerolineales bacterium]
MPTIAALLPMRHSSERVPGKNYRPMAGKPLFHYILETLLAVPEITHILVDTDSPAILTGVAENFPRVTALERPPHLRAGEIPMNEVLLNTTGQVEADWYLQTHSTNPLLKPETISRAIQQLLTSYPTFDSLFGVTRLQTRLWNGLTLPVNHNPNILLRTQDLPPIYEENSCIYLFKRETLLQRRNRLGERPLMFEIDRNEAWDIDEELDFKITEFLVQQQGKIQHVL